ncbi:hypothetical protein [Streptococcus mutans]|nr:hypothetical protein [Streptococcus mutans]EMC35134.1 hypothetical protein SMU93_08683 [Streptococcus mutans 21]
MLTKEKCAKLGIMKWVKKPIPAYAIQLVEKNKDMLKNEERLNYDDCTVQTLEGQFHFDYGDYLVVGNDNEVWTVKQVIFEATYEQV